MIVLSAFDGIGTGIYALQEIIGKPRLAMAWEIDTEAAAVCNYHMPYVKQRGDLFQDSVKEVAKLIKKYDGHQVCIIVMLSAPPCPDFSSVNGSALSFDGEEGAKFKKYIDFTKELEQELEGHTIIHLCENVIMQTNAEIQWVSEQLGANPIVADPADLGIISRPRLWWTRHSWNDKDKHPLTGRQLKWNITQDSQAVS